MRKLIGFIHLSAYIFFTILYLKCLTIANLDKRQFPFIETTVNDSLNISIVIFDTDSINFANQLQTFLQGRKNYGNIAISCSIDIVIANDFDEYVSTVRSDTNGGNSLRIALVPASKCSENGLSELSYYRGRIDYFTLSSSGLDEQAMHAFSIGLDKRLKQAIEGKCYEFQIRYEIRLTLGISNKAHNLSVTQLQKTLTEMKNSFLQRFMGQNIIQSFFDISFYTEMRFNVSVPVFRDKKRTAEALMRELELANPASLTGVKSWNFVVMVHPTTTSILDGANFVSSDFGGIYLMSSPEGLDSVFDIFGHNFLHLIGIDPNEIEALQRLRALECSLRKIKENYKSISEYSILDYCNLDEYSRSNLTKNMESLKEYSGKYDLVVRDVYQFSSKLVSKFNSLDVVVAGYEIKYLILIPYFSAPLAFITNIFISVKN